MGQREEHRLKEWIASAEVALLDSGGDTAEERFSWLAEALLQCFPEKLWEMLHKASQEDVGRIPDLHRLLTNLARRLLDAGRPQDAADVVHAAEQWEVRVAAGVYRALAEAQSRLGDPAAAEQTIRHLLKRDPEDVEALRLLYRGVKQTERTAEAHELLTRLVDVEPTAATAMFAYRERGKLPEISGRPVRIAFLSSYVIDPLIPFVDIECRRAELTPTFYVTPFNQYTQEALQPSSHLYAFGPEIVFVALDLEDLFPTIRAVPSVDELAAGRDDIRRAVTTLVRHVRARSDALIVVHELALPGASPHGILDNRRPDGLGPWTEALNRDLATELAAQTDMFLLPLRELLRNAGVDRSHSRKLYYMARMRHGDGALRELARYSMRYVKPRKGLTKKCVVVDLDGTLWGGVAGELGPAGIHLGPTAPGLEFVDFQQALLNLTKRGIVLAICSKNNPEDVLPILREHKHMVLREEHFGAIRINWRNKAENLVQIADELNLGLDALVFLDDNPVERGLIRQLLPEVLTVELPRDASQFRTTLERLTDFEVLAITREDEARAAQYQANRQRRALELSTVSVEEYLHSLEIRAEIVRASAQHVPRVAQMLNKTNQFNTTTRRYPAQEVARLVDSPDHRVDLLQVADKFGDHGIVGLAIVRKEAAAWSIDSFLLSCRVMGLSVETVLLKRIYDVARAHDVARLVGEFVPTAKNAPTADFYGRHGFRLESDANGTQAWVLDAHVSRVEAPPWIAVTVSEG